MTSIVENSHQPQTLERDEDNSVGSSSDDSSEPTLAAAASRSPSTEDLTKSSSVTDISPKKKIESLQERARTPASFYLTLASIILLEGCSGMYKLETLQSWWSSIATSSQTIYDYLDYLKVLMNAAYTGELRDTKQYMVAAVVTAAVLSLVTIFIFIPFRAGVWTGQRATKHKVHRYMGLCFLIQYALVWVEFLTDDIGTGKLGFLPHTMALNGMC